MTRRYFVADLPSAGGAIPLSDEEAHHAARVMRLKVGDEIQLFDGAGAQCSAVVAAIDKRSCVVTSSVPEAVDREPSVGIDLAVALPKGDRAKELVERLTELGVRRLVPLVCDRTQRSPSESQLSKLRRVVIEACKQSERNVLMEIDEPLRLDAYVAAIDSYGGADGAQGTVKWVLHPGGELISSAIRSVEGSASVVIGPEGGLTDDEVRLLGDAGFASVGLGPRIYRIETAAVVVAAWLAG
ncbi:16S rRNA (uracil(1498)-N(3))-methyltransferase [Stieleria sp. JC731]|uniref:RsmE family RNA methyltransferase n=1 Tax=Pirellulaceae TaxID=2691357 RepID=UPI001E4BB6C1|nr:RsmE family RNA methyltransferase [Stieleria sp. JC731]MCC9601572.1 16S rRNA (uracil(1498)-N(3))-methyltransferase [Stieleria sp. JC731]